MVLSGDAFDALDRKAEKDIARYLDTGHRRLGAVAMTAIFIVMLLVSPSIRLAHEP